MKSLNINKFALAAGTVLALAASAPVLAAPAFTFDSSGTGKTAGSTTIVADQFNGLSSELITFGNNGATASATGYFYVTGASLAGNNAANFGRFGDLSQILGSSGTYGLYLTFSLTNHLVSSDIGGNNYALDSLDFQFYIDKNNDTTFQAPVAQTGTAAKVTGGNTDDLEIASGSLVAGTGVATIGAQAQVKLTSTENFVDVNQSYFTKPNPFYALLFDAFNNTGGAYTQSTNGQFGAINGAGGNLTFSNVPEPSTVALFGIALVGMGVAARRRKS